MSCFSSTTNTTSTAASDPAKHVNYNLGMVLGADDFNQEFAYLSGRDRWMARDLVGYGTVRGLRVKTDVDAEKGPRVMVEPGVAVSPSGQMICVPTAQCAYLKNWVADHATEVSDLAGSPIPSSIPLYVVLCYRDCPVDNVPIAGEPCRTEDQLMAPSRLKDDFCLELRTKKPNQREEDAVRDFVDWLKQIGASGEPSTPLEQVLQAIRDAAQEWLTSPPSSPPASPPADFMFGSPPAFLNINPADTSAYLRAAFRLWVTELRPRWIGRWHGCAPSNFQNDDAADEDCVLLAELDVPVIPASPGAWDVPNQDVNVNEDSRPFLIHSRMLQEWMLCGRMPQSAEAGLIEPSQLKVTNLDGPAGLLLSDEQCVICNTAGGNIKLGLPPAVENDGRILIIKRLTTGASQVGINAATGETVEAQLSIVLNAVGKYVQLVASAKLKGWHIVGNN